MNMMPGLERTQLIPKLQVEPTVAFAVVPAATETPSTVTLTDARSGMHCVSAEQLGGAFRGAAGEDGELLPQAKLAMTAQSIGIPRRMIDRL